MEYKELDIDSSIKPVYHSVVRNTPLHLKESSRNYNKKLLAMDIIGVQTEPTEWNSIGFFTSKRGSSKCRFVIDYTSLNESIIRPQWPFLSSNRAMKLLPGRAGYFIALDLKNGYFQVTLPEASRKYTTFLTEEGRYYMKRFPQGLSSSSDMFK